MTSDSVSGRSGRDHTEWGHRIGALPPDRSRDELIAEVGGALREVPRGAGMVAAVSGGPDSVALVHLLSLARPDLALAVAHVRHGLRDDAADAAMASDHAGMLELEYQERTVTVVDRGAGPEAAARDARYAALRAVADDADADWLAVGHTADDQAETVLLNLVRGAGLSGIAGMRPRRRFGDVTIVRPLLGVRRSDVAAFVAGEGLATVTDPTNGDPAQRRARARQRVLPALAELAGGPGDVVGALARLAALARADADALDALAAEHALRLVAVWGPTRALRSDLLAMLPAALARRVLRLAAAQVGARSLSAAVVGRILALEPGTTADIGANAVASAGGGWIGLAPSGSPSLDTTPLVVPGATPLPQIGLTVHVEWPWPVPPSRDPGQLDLGAPVLSTVGQVGDERPSGPLAALPPGVGPRARMWAVFPAVVGAGLAAGADLWIRARRDGDRLRCSAGRRKVQDLLVDSHVPRVCRDLVPVVCDEHDEPLWVPGVAQRAGGQDDAAGLRMWLAPCSVR